MGYYDQDFLNYYYWMASQFAISDRWFSPIASKSVPNRIATFTGGTTQGLVRDPGNDDHLPQLNIANIFQELDQAKVAWKIYYTVTEGLCLDPDDCVASGNSVYPATHFSNLTYSYQYIYENPTGAACVGTNSVVTGGGGGLVQLVLCRSNSYRAYCDLRDGSHQWHASQLCFHRSGLWK